MPDAGGSTARHSRVASIEVCRGIAATMVVLGHASTILHAPGNFGVYPFGQLFLFGRSGVDFFFALSGFLIALLHWQDIGHSNRAARYAGRRLTRVYPTYWLILLLVIPFDYFTHTLFDDYAQPLEVVKSVLLLPQAHTILDVTWSMRNELLFYTLFALLILNRRLGSIVVALWLAGMVMRPFLDPATTANAWIDLFTYPMNFEFLCGVLAGWAFPRLRVRRPAIVLGAGCALFLTLWTIEDLRGFADLDVWRLILRSLLYGAASVLVIVGLAAFEIAGRLKQPRALVVLGGASYLLYLIHVPALLVLGASERHFHLLRFVPAPVLGAVFVLATVGGAVVMHIVVERPMLGWVRRVTGFKPASAAPVTA